MSLNNDSQYGTPVLQWEAPEYQEYDRGPRWKAVSALCAILFILWAIWQDTYAFAVVVILLTGLYFLTHKHHPRDIRISLTTHGILMGENFIPYADTRMFWILYKPNKGLKTTTILLKSGFMREMVLQLHSQDPEEVRDFLSSHIPELEDRTETMHEKIIRVLKL